MKIENYEGTADTFTFPTPANNFDDQGESNSQLTEIPYGSLHIQVGAGGVKPKTIVLQGHLFGSSRAANYREIAKHFIFEDDKLKKLYFEDDKFYLGLGMSARKTNSGEKVGFIDYVATFKQLVPVLFSDTQKTGTSGSPQTNAGNFFTYVEEITGTVTDGSADITFTDSTGLVLTIPASKLTTGQAISLKLVYMADVGNVAKYSYYNYLTIAGSAVNGLKSSGLGSLRIAEGASSSTISITNLSGYSIKFRDGYTA